MGAGNGGTWGAAPPTKLVGEQLVHRPTAPPIFSISYTGRLQLLEILEISWNIIRPTGNFCARCRRSTALVSSHKNMDKYLAQKYEIYSHQMWELMTIPQIPIRLGRGHRKLGVPSKKGRSKANMPWIFLKIPPGFSWKSPGNLLD